jgi:tetratricopeptide (TPR) repeat protein
MLRALGDFDRALRVLEDLIREAPADPSRPQAEMARADSLLGLAELRRDSGGNIDRQRAARAAAAYERVSETWGKESPEIQLEARHKQAFSLLERAKAEGGSDAKATRTEARSLLASNGVVLRANPGLAVSSSARVWISRSLLLLAETCEQAGDRQEAASACRIIVDFNREVEDGGLRLPGQALAESKLAALEGPQSNPKAPK